MLTSHCPKHGFPKLFPSPFLGLPVSVLMRLKDIIQQTLITPSGARERLILAGNDRKIRVESFSKRPLGRAPVVRR